jgi:CMP-N-acetylneuraminic acid synthetase
MKKILVVIPARGGSKGVPRKNIREIAGKPLIAWVIDAALRAQEQFTHLIVSTDDEEIADIARFHGANVPFIRPAELASDEASSAVVIEHAVKYMEEQEKITYDWTLLIQITNPLVQSEDIVNVIKIANKNPQASAVTSVQKSPVHPNKIKVIRDGYLKPHVDGTLETIRRQELSDSYYKRNGSLYMTRRDVLMQQGDMYGDKILPYLMPPERSFDIDTEMDLKIAETMLQCLMNAPS